MYHPPTYQYQAVTQGDLALTINATGPVQSPATYNLVAASTGKIDAINVMVGQHVVRGQVLAQLDKTALQDAVNQAQASVDADSDALFNTEVNANWYDTPAVIQARDTLKIAQSQLDAAKHNLDAATLRAPHAGIVTAINGTIGGTPGAPANGSSNSSGSFFIQVVDLSSLQVQANVNESDTANLKVGDTVQFTVNAYGDRQFKGTVSAISSNGVTSSNVATYPVTIDVNMQSAKGANLLPNMTANVTITVIQHHNVLLIPVNAINFARLASGGNATGSNQLLSPQEASTATAQARQALNNLQSQNPTIATINPLPAFVIESRQGGTRFIAVPVVLGLTDGVSYEVLSGLSANENIIVGSGGNSGSGSNSSPGGNGGNPSKGG
jgi:HlyD family secretion protein